MFFGAVNIIGILFIILFGSYIVILSTIFFAYRKFHPIKQRLPIFVLVSLVFLKKSVLKFYILKKISNLMNLIECVVWGSVVVYYDYSTQTISDSFNCEIERWFIWLATSFYLNM